MKNEIQFSCQLFFLASFKPALIFRKLQLLKVQEVTIVTEMFCREISSINSSQTQKGSAWEDSVLTFEAESVFQSPPIVRQITQNFLRWCRFFYLPQVILYQLPKNSLSSI